MAGAGARCGAAGAATRSGIAVGLLGRSRDRAIERIDDPMLASTAASATGRAMPVGADARGVARSTNDDDEGLFRTP